MPLKHFILACTISVFIVFYSCKEDKKVIKQTQVAFKKEAELTIFKKDSTQLNFDVEIADNEYETQTGLMYRSRMETTQGMLFMFDDEAPRSFYMKNTSISLDLVFIDANKTIVSFQKNAKPFDETSLSSQVPAKFVLEINAGLIDKWGISIGDSISYIY